MYNNRRNNNEYRERHERSNNLHHHTRKYSKSMILLKSTVFALFVVLVVLLAAFEIIKHRKETNLAANKCEKNSRVIISQGIEKISQEDGVLVVLTKVYEGKQEAIRLDPDCGRELSRITFSIN